MKRLGKNIILSRFVGVVVGHEQGHIPWLYVGTIATVNGNLGVVVCMQNADLSRLVFVPQEKWKIGTCIFAHIPKTETVIRN